MDHITNNKTYTASTSSSSSWDLDMTMANPLLLDHHQQHHHHLTGPFEFFHPNNMVDHLHFPPAPQLINPNSNIVPQELPYDDEAEDDDDDDEDDEEHQELGAMKEMMYKIAAMQPVDIDPSTIKKPKRRNVRISDDPQSIAARHRRERISERIRILQRLVPGGTKMDTASMLDEAIRYVKFLKRQVQELQQTSPPAPAAATVVGYAALGPPPPPPAGAGISSSGLGFAFSVGLGTNNFR